MYEVWFHHLITYKFLPDDFVGGVVERRRIRRRLNRCLKHQDANDHSKGVRPPPAHGNLKLTGDQDLLARVCEDR